MYSTPRFLALARGIILPIAFVPTLALAVITPDLVVSRTSGVAPLAVHFDASGTLIDDQSINPFGDLGYKFDFGDPSSGNWAYSGKSKNEQVGGPIAAHVYTNPGIYEAKVEIASMSGEKEVKSVQITVRPAETEFPLGKTICISTTDSLSGCPAGATQKLNATTWGTLSTGTRYLIQSGQDFRALGNMTVNCSNCQITKLGDGAKPIVKDITVSPRPANPPRGGVEIYGLATGAIDIAFGENITIFDNEIQPTTSVGGAVKIGSTVQYYYQNPGTFDPAKIAWPKNIFVIENHIDGAAPNGVCGIFALANRLTIAGNEILNPKEHDIRVALARQAFIAHNKLIAGANGTKHHIKFHAVGLQDWTTDYIGDAPTPASSKSVISSNLIGDIMGDINTWQIVLGPENAQSVQGHKMEIVEDNQFVFNPTSLDQTQVIITGINMWERGNKFQNKAGKIRVGTSGQTAAMPPGWDGPETIDGKSVSEWMPTLGTSPPAPVQLQVN